MLGRAGFVAALAALLLPASASGWTAVHVPGAGDSVAYTAADGETNTVTFGYTLITDTSATFDPTAQGSCAQVDAHTAQCATPISYTNISLGDGDDHLVVTGGSSGMDSETTTIVGGSGRDDVRGGTNDERYYMRDGEVDHINCDPPGSDGREIVEADANDVIASNCDIVNFPTPQPVDLTVNSTADTYDGVCDSDCSLRDAIKVANARGGTVRVPAGDYPYSPPPNYTAYLEIYGDVRLVGAGARTTTIHAPIRVQGYTFGPGAPSRLFISGLRLDAGLDFSYSAGPGRIEDSRLAGLNAGNAQVTVLRSQISGSGVSSFRDLTLIDSTVAGNSGAKDGGGLYLVGKALVRNSTIAGNTADSDASSAVYAYQSYYFDLSGQRVDLPNQLEFADSIIWGGCTGTLLSLGNNIADPSCGLANAGDTTADPMLGPLQDNGGPTDTMALLAGSPAIDAIHYGCIDEQGSPLSVDQRGIERPQGDGCDIGAYEAVPSPPPPEQAPAPVMAPAPPGPALAAPAPAIESLTLDPRRFRPARYGGLVATSRRTGATVRYRLSVPGTITVRVLTAGGRKLGGAAHILASATQGRFGITGRVSGKALRPGRYRLSALLRTPGGAASPVLYRSFVIAK